MKVMAAGKAKNGFGLLIDTARSEPVTIEKHWRPVAVVLSAEEYERLRRLAGQSAESAGPRIVRVASSKGEAASSLKLTNI
jgi:prevent-host-death family protein